MQKDILKRILIHDIIKAGPSETLEEGHDVLISHTRRRVISPQNRDHIERHSKRYIMEPQAEAVEMIGRHRRPGRNVPISVDSPGHHDIK